MACIDTSTNYPRLTSSLGLLLKDSIGTKTIRDQSEIEEINEKLGYKIREAQMQKNPYILKLGNNELKKETVNDRK